MGTTLITGASGAIGRETARKLAEAGESLYLHFNTGKERVRQIADELSRIYPNQTFSCIQADLSVESGTDKLLDQLDGPVTNVVYNCGKSLVGLFQDTTPQTVKEFIQLQLTSPFLILQKLIQPMIRVRKGKVIIVSSIWGLTGASTEVLYSMVKGGQNTFVKALAKEVAPSGISVNAVAPGAVDTPMMNEFDEEDIEQVRQDIPMGRLARPEEVASLIRFLITPEADYISGQVLSINGAWYC
ncbi:SDR family oxidoreductase [Sporolactobacillus sp. THM7-4]|nr:SDR family oxidoreductase [Sporolactobacillus sp. THM7-4]